MDFVILPTYREGFPNVALEAAAMELPVLATSVTGCVDAVVDGVTGMLVPARDSAPWNRGCECISMTRKEEMRTEKQGGSVQFRILDPNCCGRLNIRNMFGSLVKRELPFPIPQRLMIIDEKRPAKITGNIKRLTDILIAGAALVCLSPIMAVTACLIWFSMGSPVIFRQRRAGFLGRPFDMAKFRTMTEERDDNGELLPDSQRLTGLGSFLRRNQH